MEEGLHSFRVKILQAPKKFFSTRGRKGQKPGHLSFPKGNHNRTKVLGLSLGEEHRTFIAKVGHFFTVSVITDIIMALTGLFKD